MRNNIIAHESERVKASRDRTLHANRRHLAKVILGVLPPAWVLEIQDEARSIRHGGGHPHLDLLANVEVALAARRVGVAT